MLAVEQLRYNRAIVELKVKVAGTLFSKAFPVIIVLL